MSVVASIEQLTEVYERQFRDRIPVGLDLHDQARQVLAGGFSGNGKSWRPLYLARAQGAHIRDVDGNEYIDLDMGFGPNLLGHSPEVIVNRVQQTLAHGTVVGLATELEIELAEAIRANVPSMELMRFVGSGTEATMMALRAARAFTGKPKVAKFEGHYHGQHDAVLVSSLGGVAGSASEPEGTLDCAGLAPQTLENTIVLPWDDIEAAASIIERHRLELAAVICEPVPNLMLGGNPPDQALLRTLRELTAAHGILLVFDEVVTGFRLGLGGAAEYFGVVPDLHTFGKVVGGGMPIGVYGGSADVMDAVVAVPAGDPRKIFQSGTFSGTPAAMAAGIAMIETLESTEAIAVANERASTLREGWRAICDRLGLAAEVTGTASWFTIFFTEQPVRSRREALRSDARLELAFSLGLLVRGVYFMQSHPGFTSSAHSEADIETALEASAEVLAEIGRSSDAGGIGR